MKKFTGSIFKSFLLMAVAGIMVLALTACGEEVDPNAVQPEEQIDYEVALITDDSLIMDGGHSEMAWNAISLYCAEKGLSHKYYKAAENTKNAYEDAIDMAVDNGAKIVIADNDSLSDAVYKAEEKYEDVKFMILNADPVDDENGDVLVSGNTVAVTFASEEAGYLAGYAAVKEGYTSLGFIGQSNDKMSAPYGYGFLKGANRAAVDSETEIKMHYVYAADADEAYAKAESWYGKDVQVIMACGNEIDRNVIRTAESASGKVICCQSDKSQLSDTVLTSAVINVDKAIRDIMSEYSSDKFPGGNIVEYNASNDGVSLALKVNGFKNLQQKDYDEVYEDMAKGKIKVRIDNVTSVDDIKADHVKLIKK